MAAIDLVVLLCSVLIFGLPTLASHMICLHGDEDSRLVGIAEKTQDWLQYLVSNTYSQACAKGGGRGGPRIGRSEGAALLYKK